MGLAPSDQATAACTPRVGGQPETSTADDARDGTQAADETSDVSDNEQ